MTRLKLRNAHRFTSMNWPVGKRWQAIDDNWGSRLVDQKNERLLMPTLLRFFARWFHRLVFQFEHFFSVPAHHWVRGLTAQEAFMYQFGIAERLRFTFPERSSGIFMQLLGRLDDQAERLDPVWSAGRRGRIYYYLGTLAGDADEQARLYRACLVVMPEHYMAKEALFRMGRWSSEGGS
jgi:hypothetical protein